MTKQPTCPTCGTLVPAGAPGGACPRCLLEGGLGTAGSSGPGTAGGAPAWAPPPDRDAAGLFAGFEDITLVGQGGMGAVYRARQAGLDRTVAIKLLPPRHDRDPEPAERFRREAQALAKLKHPNIVTLFDSGTTPGRHDYFVMEYVDGVNLAELIASGELAPERALAIASQLCDGLQHAHDMGFVHRDIKPANILVDRTGTAKIADFGLAKLVPSEGVEVDLTLTDLGHAVGTPRYMAPEQSGSGSEIDHRADLYALGVVIYEMLTGEVPAGHFRPPSKLSPVSRRLDRVVLRAMDKEVGRRYQSAGELKASLARALAAAPVRTWLALAAAGAVLGAIAYASWGSGRPEPPRTNSLGMQFRRVPGTQVLFSVWETRVSDFAAFAAATGYRVKEPDFPQGPDHPAVDLTWRAAEAFCNWLTRTERESGALAPGEHYRLPTDREWSRAVGSDAAGEDAAAGGGRGGTNPFPWGDLAPVPQGAGNYPDRSLQLQSRTSLVVPGYYDGFAATAPAGSFAPNRFGLYDLGGNAWEWVSPPASAGADQLPVMRGGSWWNSFLDDDWEETLASGYRKQAPRVLAAAPDVGFRIVLASAPEPGADRADREPDIFAAAAADDARLALSLLEGGVDTDARNRAGRTPLSVAAQSGATRVVELLLEHGADTTGIDEPEIDPLFLAVNAGRDAVVEALLAHDREGLVGGLAGEARLCFAVSLGDQKSVQFLLGEGVDPDAPLLGKAMNPLTTAVMMSELDVLELLLASGATLPGPADQGGPEPALRLAAVNGDAEALAILVGHGAELGHRGGGRASTLLHAVAAGPSAEGVKNKISKALPRLGEPMAEALGTIMGEHVFRLNTGRDRKRIVRDLLLHGFAIDAVNEHGQSPLNVAALHGTTAVVEELAAQGADVALRDDAGFTPLLSALEKGVFDSAQVLVAHGGNLRDSTTGKRESALHLAARSGSTEAVRWVLDSGEVDVDARRHDGTTALAYAISHGHAGVVEMLVRAGADTEARVDRAAHQTGGFRPVHFAAAGRAAWAKKIDDAKRSTRYLGSGPVSVSPGGSAADFLRCLEILAGHGVDLEATANAEKTPLHVAAEWGNTDTISRLLAAGVRIGPVDGAGETPLAGAARAGATAAVEALLEAGAVPRPGALIAAARGGHLDAATVLLDHGAPIDGADRLSATALHWAAVGGDEVVVRFLLDHGAEVDSRDMYYSTPLHQAAHLGHFEVARVLLNGGANPRARQIEGLLPATLAHTRNHTALAEYLLEQARLDRSHNTDEP